ncbi:hypothetical protein [Frankia sp. EAN1pec]|uniref:hypothetical protein n=1 Tax=Parafrankia sp. (strain EAN1pec) TaxID=298653 RepID=UPI0012F8D8B0
MPKHYTVLLQQERTIRETRVDTWHGLADSPEDARDQADHAPRAWGTASRVVLSTSPADSEDVLTFTASRFFPSRSLLEAAGRLVPGGPGDVRGQIADAVEEIHTDTAGIAKIADRCGFYRDLTWRLYGTGWRWAEMAGLRTDLVVEGNRDPDDNGPCIDRDAGCCACTRHWGAWSRPAEG